MNTKNNAVGDQPGWLLLLIQALLIGAFTGLVVGVFRYLNDHITLYFVRTIGNPLDKGVGMAVVIFGGLLVFALLSILYLHWERLIGGSGIPQVEIMIHGDLQMNWWRVLLTKFFGALTSLAGGLSLGREGPCIMMGASLGVARSEEHTSDSSHVAISYAVFCLKKKTTNSRLSGWPSATGEGTSRPPTTRCP